MSDAADRPFDALETRDPAAREAALLAALPTLVAHAQQAAPAYANLFAGVDAAAVTTRAALAALPVTRKHELLERQQASRARGGDPFGGYSAVGWAALGLPGRARRVYQSPGPIYEPEGEREGTGGDSWRMARALHAAGFRAGDLVHNSFSYHLTPAGVFIEAAAQTLGCTVFPGGVGNTELQLQAMRDLAPDGYAGTPSFLRILVEKAEAAGAGIPRLRKALVSGEAFPAPLRDSLAARGIQAFQCYATAELGLVAYETEAREGLVVDEGVLLEIVRPGTGDPVPPGEVGEIVVTTLNRDHPLIRFGTGDLSAVLPGVCPSGRTNLRIRGWLGRADQTAKVRGMFVHPAQVAAIGARHPEARRLRLVVDGAAADDRMVLHVEVEGTPEGLAERIAQSVRELTKLRGEVLLLPPGSLPNDGKLVDDRRPLA